MFSILKKKKKRSVINEVDYNNREVVYDFRCRADELFIGYRAIGYKMPPLYDIESKKEENAQRLAQLIMSHAVDAGNDDCLIDRILADIREGLRYLDDQSIEHMDFYERQKERAASDSIDLGKIIELYKEKEECMLKEHEKTTILFNRHCECDSVKESDINERE